MLLNGSLLDGASHPALHTIRRNIDLKKTPKSQNIFSRSFCPLTGPLLALEKAEQVFSCLKPCLCLVVRTAVILVCLIYFIYMSLSLLKMRREAGEALALADQKLNHNFLRDFIDDGFACEEDC